jgi:penicillin amidase
MWLNSSIPPLSGRERVGGLGDSVTVLWDSLAVPHVIAQSDSDLFTALGYLHARDRMWEMDLLRHAAEGRLSELFGATTVGADRNLRTLEIARLAAARIALTGSDARRLGEAYARGVNAWLAVGTRAPEFRLVGHTPEPWRPENSIEIGLLESWDLHTTQNEIERARAVANIGATKAADLFVGYPDSGPVIVEGTAGHGVAVASMSDDEPGTASNSWAIGPSHTRSGKPILANDPHLTLRAPSIWYLVGAHAPGYNVVGVTIPGIPGVVLGHTADHAWGFTNGMIDDVDYVLEQLSPDSARYRTATGWADVTVVTETLLVHDRAPVVYQRRRTADGPLVDVGWTPDAHSAFAFRWTAQDPSDVLTALLGMGRARTRAEFVAALSTFRAPEQNVVYADSTGMIAYNLAGFVPVRHSGDGSQPLPGWTGTGRWDRYLSAAELPEEVNPPSGFVVTANNRIVGPAYKHAIPADYDFPYRAQRIWELVHRDTALTAAQVAREQVDVVNVFLRQITPVVAQAADAAGKSELAADLRRWDGDMNGDRWEPTLVWSWYKELQRLHYEGKSTFRPSGPLHRWLLYGVHPWPHDSTARAGEDLAALARTAMEHVLARGTPPAWRRVHTHTEEHPLGAVPLLNRLVGFNIGPLPLGGGNYTVDVCPASEYAPPYHCNEGPSMRHVVDFGDVDGAGGFILPAGQSGHPRSPHYRDMTDRWIRGELWIVPVDVRKVRAVDTLTLTPRP